MKIARGVVTQPDNEIRDYLRVVKEADLDFVELMLDGPTDRHWLSQQTKGENDIDLEDTSILVHLPFKGLDLGSPFGKVRSAVVKELHECHVVADKADAKKVVLHPNALGWGKAHSEDFLTQQVIKTVSELKEMATEAELSAEITVENIYDSIVSVHDFPNIFDQTGVSMTFDTGHARIDGLNNREMAEFLSSYSGRVSHIHLNDTRGPEDEHLPIGFGTIEFTKLFNSLPSDWDGTMSLEVTTTNMNYIKHSANNLDAMLKNTK